MGESLKRNPGQRRATVGLVDEGEGAEAHKAFVKVERMTMYAVMMALSLLVLLTLMAVARTHEVDGRRMLQFKKTTDVEDVPGFPDSGEYKKLCNKFFGGLEGCKDSKVLRAYNKKRESEEEDEDEEDYEVEPETPILQGV